MSLKTPYCSVAEADVILQDNNDWLSSTETNKLSALTEARYYLDSSYSCSVDENDIPEELKVANAWLANDALVGEGLYDTATTTEYVKSKMVKAGPVTTSKEFFSPSSFTPATKAKVDTYLAGICFKLNSNASFLVRA